MASYSFVRFNKSTQCNVYVDMCDVEQISPTQSFDEVVLTWNSQKLNRPLWKTKKFYNSHSVEVAEAEYERALKLYHLGEGHDYTVDCAGRQLDTVWGDTCFGKCLGYVNKLQKCGWLTDAEYNAMYSAVLALSVQSGKARRIYGVEPIGSVPLR